MKLPTLLLASLALCACAAPPPEAELADAPPVTLTAPTMVEAERLFRELRYRECMDLLRIHLAAFPEDRRARELYQRAEWICAPCKLIEPVQAHRLLRERVHGIHRARDEVAAKLSVAEELLAEGDREGAEALCSEALEVIRWFPYRLDTGLEEQARRLFARAWPERGEWSDR